MKIFVSLGKAADEREEEVPVGWDCISYTIDVGDRVFDVYFKGNRLSASPGLEAGLALAILPGMRLRRAIHVKGSISHEFLQGVRDFMVVWARHFPEFEQVSVTADSYYQACPASTPKVASFFSGGVDSFFTWYKGMEQISDVVFIHGFDMSIKALERRAIVSEKISEAAAEMGVGLVEVETNLTTIVREYGDWLRHGHGLGMIAVSRVLGHDISEIRIPGSYSIDQQRPWGSWLATDQLFSDQRLKVVHDACVATRADKVESLSRCDTALKYLRVCSEKKAGNVYNCCRCEKCLRTMVSLYAFGSLEKAASFPLSLETRLVSGVLLPRVGLRIFPEENIALLKSRRADSSELVRALEKQMRRPVWWARLKLKWQRRVSRWSGQLSRVR